MIFHIFELYQNSKDVIETYSKNQTLGPNSIFTTEYIDGMKVFQYTYAQPMWVPLAYVDGLADIRHEHRHGGFADDKTYFEAVEENLEKYHQMFLLTTQKTLENIHSGKTIPFNNNSALVIPMHLRDFDPINSDNDTKIEELCPNGLPRLMWTKYQGYETIPGSSFPVCFNVL